MNLLPRHEEAVIPLRKFTHYCLDPNRDPNKADAFDLALGYTKDTAAYLIENIRHLSINKWRYPPWQYMSTTRQG